MTNTDRLTEKIARWISEHELLSQGQHILCGVSGGLDSMCMLTILRRLGYPVTAAHFNHQLRGAESDGDEAFVREYCKINEIPFFSGTGDVRARAKEMGKGIEETARILRYEFLNSLALELSIDKIAIAHNQNDSIETIIFNLTRGSGPRGLGGISPINGKIIRPLLCLSRSEIEQLASALHVPHVEDSSNNSLDYSRNYIRHVILPALSELNPRADSAILRSSGLIKEDDDYLTQLAQNYLNAHCDDNNTLYIPTLLELALPISSRVIRIISGITPSNKHIRSVLDLCRSDSAHGHTDLPGLRVTKSYDRLIFSNALNENGLREMEIVPGETIFPGGNLVVSSKITTNWRHFNSSLKILCFKCDNIYGKVFVRSRIPGDKIRLSGRGCTKSLKKLFSESRIPLEDRQNIPVFYDQQGVIAVGGIGVAERVMASQGDQVLLIEISEK